MRLPFLRPKPDAEPSRAAASKAERARKPAPDDGGLDVSAARTRARRRLVGAVVLLVAGVVGFPVLFETTPRPLPLDTPFEVPRREAAALTPPPAAVPARPLPVPSLPADAGTEVATAPVAASGPAPAAAPATVRPESAVATVVPPPVRASAPAPVARQLVPPATVPATAPTAPTAALAATAGGRFVVQVGAYTDAAMLREARAKVEKLGMKSYTQVIENDAGKRTRVRVGPYATRAEAEAAAAKVKKVGLPANVLTL